MHRKRIVMTATIPLLALLATACSSDPSPGVDPVSDAPTSDAAPVTAAPADAPDQAPVTAAPVAAPGSSIAAFSDAQPAIIQIEAMGGTRDPELGGMVTGGRGSGFLLSADGLALTNNHVVTGAATLKVYVGGDTTKSYNARVIGASECNDLALIDISEDAPLPYLDWATEPATVGQEIYVAGFPLGDPEYTLTRGIISKAQADGEGLSWASIDRTIEHDAQAHPGNSGGPLLNPQGQVMGIHYSGAATEHQTRLGYAIDHQLAQIVLGHLQQGDYESLGIAATPVFDEGLGISGIWVNGVKPGSPAAKAKVVPGDIITALNGLPMAMDGDMDDYCDVLRTAGDNAPMAIEVLRWDTQEVLRGELNNPNEQDQAMVPVMSFAQEIGDDMSDGGEDEYTYEQVVDDTNSILIEVPTEWSDHLTTPGVISPGQPFIQAAASIEGLDTTWTEPGLIYTVVETTEDLEGLIDGLDFAADCEDDGLQEYTDGLYTGFYHRYSNCGGSGNQVMALAATPNDQSFTALLLVQMMYDRDALALDHAFATFNYYAD